MEPTSSPGFWIAIAIGGAVIAALSAAQQFMKDKSEPYSEFSIKPVARDFCIGAFLTAAIYMMIPDSIQSLVTKASEWLPKSSGAEVELQTGPARF
jgi:hypothetical protein